MLGCFVTFIYFTSLEVSYNKILSLVLFHSFLFQNHQTINSFSCRIHWYYPFGLYTQKLCVPSSKSITNGIARLIWSIGSDVFTLTQ